MSRCDLSPIYRPHSFHWIPARKQKRFAGAGVQERTAL